MIKKIKTNIKGLFLIKTKIFKDNRGFFKEIEKNKILKKKFIFDCFSFSKKKYTQRITFAEEKKPGKNNYGCARKNLRCCS